ncbi:MAG: DUF2817 domain-containing protein [Achromobacter sp.]|nr:DUF2817 domain-containing protein [Achromobacter sp.]
MNPSACFSQSYAEARGKFLAACAAAGLAVESHDHPLPGRDGEPLALDVARDGPEDASRLLIISSGCHGVEGFCGSAVQTAMLRDPHWRARVHESGCAVLYLHAVNPYGFSWWRRWTHENVDLNRNFLDFSAPLPENPAYARLDPLLVPRRWPSRLSRARLLLQVLRHGRRHLQQAVSCGQSSHPHGLFYVGAEPTWSNGKVRQVLRQQGRRCRELGWIDVHTGLGPRGHGEKKIYAGRRDEAEVARARNWWGSDIAVPYQGSSASVDITGHLAGLIYEACPDSEPTLMALEFGTLPWEDVVLALRGRNWLRAHPEAGPAQRREILQATLDAFYCGQEDWQGMVLGQSRVAVLQALCGLEA